MEMILRAYLLDGKGVEAARLVRALNKMYPDKDAKGQDSDGGALQTGDPLMTQMINYVADLRAAARLADIANKKDVATAKKSEADRLSAGLKAMLDDIAKTPQGLKPAWNRLVAKGYLSVNDSANAAVFVQQDTGAPASGAPAAKVQAYIEERLLYVRALREAGNLPGAEKAIADLKKQDDALVAAKQTALFAGEPMLMFEQASLLDAKKKFNESWKDWKALANKTTSKVGKSRMEKELYFQAYCNYVRAGFKSITDDEKDKQEKINQAARAIVDLENRWPDMGGDVSKVRFLQMLDSEPVLKQAYDNLKGDKKGS
jgi:hypothetical protein